MEPDELDWIKVGVAMGWLKWYSFCSAHQSSDPECERCNHGTWHLAAYNGVPEPPPWKLS